VERVGEAMAMMVSGRAAEEARPEEADPERSFAAEFGDLHPHLLRVDSSSAALLLRRPWRIRRYALLLIQREGADADAAAHEAAARRALELLLCAEAIEPRGELELFAALAASVDLGRMEPAGGARGLAGPRARPRRGVIDDVSGDRWTRCGQAGAGCRRLELVKLSAGELRAGVDRSRRRVRWLRRSFLPYGPTITADHPSHRLLGLRRALQVQ